MKPGRRSYWETRIEPRLEEIAAWCRDGHTDIEMCKALGISVSVFCKYKREKEQLVQALKVNKAIADLTVENSLYKRANGYRYKETVKEIKTGPDGEVIFKHAKEIEKEALPDTTAQIFWLKNRKQKEWRDKQEMELSGDPDKPVIQKLEIEFVKAKPRE